MTTQEFIKSNLFISQDNQTAYLHSHDVVGHIEDVSDKDDAFNEAVAAIERLGWYATECENDTVEGGCTQHFKRD